MKPVLTIRVTAIEAVRQLLYCVTEENEAWINEPNVIDTLKGVERYNVKAAYGSAGHAIIENPLACKVEGGYKVDDFFFTDQQAAPLIKFHSEHPLMTREVPISKAYDLQNCTLLITGTTDHIEGIICRDTKFKFSSFDVQDFMDSYQYRLYLDMLGMKHFIYDFFPVKSFNGMEDMSKSVIKECEPMPLVAYKGMQEDIYSMLNEVMDFVQAKGLEQYLKIDDKKAKKIIAGNPALKSLI